MNNFEEYLEEAIKGWKNAHSDLAKMRREEKAESSDWHTHKLTSAGTESGMHDARKAHVSEDAAEAHVANLKKLNPSRTYKHNLYHDGKVTRTIE